MKFGVGKISGFEISLLCSQMHLFDPKLRKNSNIVKYYYNLK